MFVKVILVSYHSQSFSVYVRRVKIPLHQMKRFVISTFYLSIYIHTFYLSCIFVKFVPLNVNVGALSLISGNVKRAVVGVSQRNRVSEANFDSAFRRQQWPNERTTKTVLIY